MIGNVSRVRQFPENLLFIQAKISMMNFQFFFFFDYNQIFFSSKPSLMTSLKCKWPLLKKLAIKCC